MFKEELGKVWFGVNGKKVKIFTARSVAGERHMTLGDIYSGGKAGLNGDIQFFALYKSIPMSNAIISVHHKMICERYGVDHNEISFV